VLRHLTNRDKSKKEMYLQLNSMKQKCCKNRQKENQKLLIKIGKTKIRGMAQLCNKLRRMCR
jgi:hypothetical protein